jgi:uncharacterized peroxidase-related enzyme
VVHHRRGLRRLLKDDALAARVEADWMTAGLDARRTAMLAYAAKLTRTPGTMARTDVEALRDAGFADADVLAIAEVVGYYAYVNRIADGLGVEPEPEGAEGVAQGAA